MLILLRHGQTTANASSLLQGRMDLPLDDVGRAQARLCGEHIRAAFPGARVVSSPLRRAIETAKAITDDVTIDHRFIELDYGDWDGMGVADVGPDTWSEWRADVNFRPPNGESLVDLDRRVRPALEELSTAARHEVIVVVSHVSPIKSAISWALGVGPEASWRCHLERASISRIVIGPRGPSLTGMNDTSHLRH